MNKNKPAPFVIGIVGKPAAGKGTVIPLIEKIALLEFGPKIVVKKVRFSDVLRERLLRRGIPETRENLQKDAQDLEKEGILLGEGPGALSREIGKRIEKMHDAHIAIVDGARWLTDEKMIRSFERHGAIIYIKASFLIRWRRIKTRAENTGDSQKTFLQFLKEDCALTERFVREIGKRADLEIENETSVEHVRHRLVKFLNANVFPFCEI